MVNKGQILKSHLEQELNEKILKTEAILDKLNLAFETQLNQIRNIQEGINAAHLSIGSLKSTLDNLENIDQNQILNIKLPDLSWIENIQILSGLEVTNISTHKVEKEINDWEKVGAELGGSPSKFLCDGKREIESISSSMSDEFEFELVFNDELGKMVVAEKKNTSGSKVACSNENDPILMDFEQEDDLSKWLKPKEKRFKSLAQNDLMNLVEIQNDNDLTKWLKPKDMKKTLAAAEVDANKIKKKILEFPTLQMSPDSWILRKNSKKFCNNNHNITSNYQKVCQSDNDLLSKWLKPKGMKKTPATVKEDIIHDYMMTQYAKPYPFWLKKKAY